jgi:protein-S-isoprenylcysteine O-methyltransferase Ste14
MDAARYWLALLLLVLMPPALLHWFIVHPFIHAWCRLGPLRAYALLTNYLATRVLYLLALPALYAVVRLEERELRERFGAAYAEYCRRVPRLIPRLR